MLDTGVNPPVPREGIMGIDGSGSYRVVKVNADGELIVNPEAGFEIPAYDYIALTYVASGNGAGEIETATFKTGGSGGSTVATLTLAYNSDNEISSVTKT